MGRIYTGMMTAALALATLFGGCASVELSERVEDDVRLELVEWARLAQNAHNFQPWRIVLDAEHEDTMHLYVETDRLLPQTDPPARQVTLSIGTFLAVVDARAAGIGYEAEIDLLPDGPYDLATIGERRAATVKLVRREGTESPYAVAAELDAISQPTLKYRYRPAELGPQAIDRIESYSADGILVDVITDAAQVAWLNDRSIEAFSIEMRNEPTLLETYESSRATAGARRRTPYGLAFTANFPARILWLVEASQGLFPQKPEAWAETGIDMFSSSLDEVTTYVMLRTSDNSRETQIRAGIVLQAIWMELHAAGHVALANSQGLQEYDAVREIYDALHTRYAGDGATIQMLLAVARPKGGRHLPSPRFDVDDLVEQAE